MEQDFVSPAPLLEVRMNEEELNKIINSFDSPSGKLLGILEEIQNRENYLPKKDLQYVSKVLSVPLSNLYSLATFYSFFNLQPVGKHIITVCMGTACHVKGAPHILETIEELLQISPGETTPDGKFMLTTKDRSFTVNTARCFGACSMAPVIRVDGKIYGYNTPKKVREILKKYGWKEK